MFHRTSASFHRTSASILLLLACGAAWAIHRPALGQESPAHAHGDASAAKAPKLFLDKSLKVIEYQLKRLSNAELVLAERSTDDVKYIPVYRAILLRSGLASGERRAAAEALAKLEKNSIVEQLLKALESITGNDNESTRSMVDLTTALVAEPKAALAEQSATLVAALSSSSTAVRRAAVACLLTIDQRPQVLKHATSAPAAAIDFLAAMSRLREGGQRDSLRSDIVSFLEASQPIDVRRQAIAALALTRSDPRDSFKRLGKLFGDSELRSDAVKALLTIPAQSQDATLANELLEKLVSGAESTPIADRTNDAFIDAMQLAEQLLVHAANEDSKDWRDRMRRVSVRVVRIRTVEEEMRYDLKYFAVEAGRPVEIVLINEDLMPHNLVITQPAALKEIAIAAAQMAPDELTGGKQYVPASSKLLWATSMVPAGKQERLAFEAPSTPGEYPFVCTFPNHWMRMYGVMVVVSDLDAWQKQPVVPADPIGNNRSFVAKWSMPDLAPHVDAGLRGRSPEIGARLLKEATCLQCHKMQGQGGSVGPDLTDVATRWKSDAHAILQEIIAPSHKVDPKYAMQSILTSEGKVYSGIIVEETKEQLSIITTPEQTQPTKIARDDIDEIIKSSKSIMPAGLLDQYTQDEIFELLAYLLHVE